MPKEVKYTISADSSKYERAMGRVKKATASAEVGINRAFKAAGLIGAMGVGAFTLMARQSLKMGDEIHKLNLRLGISTEALSELRHVSNLSGVSFNTLSKSYQKMSENISDANQGIGTAKDSIKDLGLNVGYLMSLSPERQFEEIADAMKGISNQSDKVRIAADIFGGRGVEMLQVMAKGAAGIREMREEAGELNLTLSQQGANDIAAFNDEVVRLKGAIMGTVQVTMVNLAPVLTETFRFFGEVLPSGINYSIEAYNALSRAMVATVQGGTEGLIIFYDILSKIPLVGDPYKEAAAGLRTFSVELEGFNAVQLQTISINEQFKAVGADSNAAARALGVPPPEVMDAELARLVEAEEMKFQIAMQSQTKLEEMLVGARQRQLEADRIASEQRLSFYQSAAGGIAQTFMMISQAGGKQSKQAFKIYQTFSIIEAMISAYKAISKTLAEPALPYPSNVAMAAIIGAKAMMQAKLIASAKAPSYDMGGISTTPGYYYAGVPEAHIPIPSGGNIPVVIEGGSRMSTIVNINMLNPKFEDKETRELVFSEIAETVVDRVAPVAVFNNYNDDGIIREMVRMGE